MVILLLAAIVLCGPAIFLLCFIIRRHFVMKNYVRHSRIPYVKLESYFNGSFYNLVTPTQSIAKRIENNFQLLGDTWFLFAGEVPFVFTKDLDLLYQVWVKDSHKHVNRPTVSTPSEFTDVSLLQSRDDAWRRTRRAIAATMTPSKLKAANVERDVDDCLDKLMSSLMRRSKHNGSSKRGSFVLDCSVIFKNFVMDTFLSVAFDQPNQIDYDLEENNIVASAKDVLKKANSTIVTWSFFIQGLTPIIQLIVKIFKLNGFIRSLCDMLNSIFDKMADNPEIAKNRRKMIHSLLDLYKEKKLDREELTANTYFLLLAGWDTTSDSLAALMWQLAMNPDIQTKLRSEIVKDGVDSNYLLWVIKESLRLHPPAATAREIGEDFHWKGYTMKKGMALIMAPYSLMRDKRVWGDDVDVFRPERFDLDDNRLQQQHPAQYVAFGLGPRNCVGFHLAMLELKMTTCQLLLNYTIRPSTDTPKSLILKEGSGTIFFVNMLRDSMPLEFVPLNQ